MINKIVFHGDDQDELNHNVVFFSINKDFSSDYGNVKQYFLTLNNPFHTCNENDVINLINTVGTLNDSYDDIEYNSFQELEESGLLGSDTWELFEPHVNQIKLLGYDGMIIYEGGIENYVSFYSNQYELMTDKQIKLKEV